MFFSWDPQEREFCEHETAEQAKDSAEEVLQFFRDEAGDGWDEEVHNIVWGQIIGRVVQTKNEPAPEGSEFDSIADYGFIDSWDANQSWGEACKVSDALRAERDAALARANAAEARVRDLEGTLMGMGAESSTRADVIRGLRARVKELEAEAIELEATATRAVDHDDTQNARVRLENAALKKALDETHDICAQLSAQLDAHKRALDEALNQAIICNHEEPGCNCDLASKWRRGIRATAKGETK